MISGSGTPRRSPIRFSDLKKVKAMGKKKGTEGSVGAASEKSDSEDVKVSDGSGDETAADFDKHTGDVKEVEDDKPSEDEPHGHPFQPTSAEPVLVTHGGEDDEARTQTSKSTRDAGTYRKISESEAYDDPEFNPVAAADVPGHKGGPDAEGGSERAEGVTDSGHDEEADNLDYNWKNPDEQPK